MTAGPPVFSGFSSMGRNFRLGLHAEDDEIRRVPLKAAQDVLDSYLFLRGAVERRAVVISRSLPALDEEGDTTGQLIGSRAGVCQALQCGALELQALR